MFKTIARVILATRLAAAAFPLSVAAQQSDADKPAPVIAPPAPVPAPILTAKKVFISFANGGVDSDIWPDHYSGGPNRAYDQFYAAMKSWGRYQPVSAPAEADLVLELQFTDRPYVSVTNGSGGSHASPSFALVVRDLKTGMMLWSFREDLETRNTRSLTHDQSFDYARGSLVNDLAKLGGQPQVIDVEALKKKKPDASANYNTQQQ